MVKKAKKKTEQDLRNLIPALRESKEEIASDSGDFENEIQDSVNGSSFGDGSSIKSYHPFAIRQDDKVWIIYDPTCSESPIFCLPDSVCPSSPTWQGGYGGGSTAYSNASIAFGYGSPAYTSNFVPEEEQLDVFTNWARKFSEIKFYTLQREDEDPMNTGLTGITEVDNWLKLISN